MAVLKQAFPKSVAMQYANFMSGDKGSATPEYLRSIYQKAVEVETTPSRYAAGVKSFGFKLPLWEISTAAQPSRTASRFHVITFDVVLLVGATMILGIVQQVLGNGHNVQAKK